MLECESGKWGDECQNDCLCEPENTEICSTDSGHCECQTGWAGPSCETDINECLQEDICDTETEVCENRNGTYDCKCKNGLGRHDVLGCIGIELVFMYYLITLLNLYKDDDLISLFSHFLSHLSQLFKR